MSLKTATKLEEAGVYELEVTVDAATFEDAVNKAYLKQRKNITVHGFRKGKLPVHLLSAFMALRCFMRMRSRRFIRRRSKRLWKSPA